MIVDVIAASIYTVAAAVFLVGASQAPTLGWVLGLGFLAVVQLGQAVIAHRRAGR